MTGEKVLLRWYRGYLVSVVYGSARASAKAAARDVMTLSIYDIQNQFVGESRLLRFTEQFTDLCRLLGIY